MSKGPDPDPRWKQWRAAEEALAEPDRLEPVAAALPPRQGWILRAMAALDGGERDEVDQLSMDLLTAGELDLACILRLVLLEPDAIDPTEIRRRSKELGVANGPGLPRLDLIRLLAVALAGSKPTRPPSLAKAGWARPVLDALLPLLSPKFTLYSVEAELLLRSRRMAERWAVSAAWRAGKRDVRKELRRLIPDAHETFDPRGWPDLEQSEAGGSLERWLATSPPPPWRADLDLVILSLRSAPRDRRRRILGALLGRIDLILREGRPAEAPGPVCLALDLLEGLDGLSHRQTLKDQLIRLLLRLDWWTPNEIVPAEIFATLWRERAGAPPAERLALARELMDDSDRADSMSPRLMNELALEIIASPEVSEDEAVALLIVGGRAIPRKTLARALEGREDRSRVELLLGVHEVACKEVAAGLQRAARLLALPDGQDAASRLAILVLDSGLDPGARVPRRLRGAFKLLLTALEEHPPALFLAARLHAEILRFLGREGLETWRGRLAPSLARTLGDAPAAPAVPVAQAAETIAVLAFLEDEERGRAQVRELGRTLRARATDPSAWTEAALATCNLLAHRDLRPPLVQSALDGISAFLLHRGPAHLADLLRAPFESSPLVAAAMSAWIAEHRDELDEDPIWDEVEGHGAEMQELMDLIESIGEGFEHG